MSGFRCRVPSNIASRSLAGGGSWALQGSPKPARLSTLVDSHRHAPTGKGPPGDRHAGKHDRGQAG